MTPFSSCGSVRTIKMFEVDLRWHQYCTSFRTQSDRADRSHARSSRNRAESSAFSIDERDPAAPDFSISFNVFAAATKLYPSDGAYGTARYGCTSTAVYEFDVHSCADDPGAASIGPGCIAAYFRQSGVTGVYVQADGAQCTLQGGKATLQLPPPQSVIPPPGASSDAAAGDFVLDCLRGDGSHRQLIGRFKIPIDSQFLLC